ncbi:hypothetical protein N7495_003986 [Penicillium taxi]|uniref:uncharacterized protein n=1 Tax=Penicillium taxi TaxID=168475 RepID=UPI0025455A10|nr:uncharacterized protein N7495_003986 [Penicillium taxi]KAJ5899242.1 hypothetical protein N7495_003986 [Penicillium taxi]
MVIAKASLQHAFMIDEISLKSIFPEMVDPYYDPERNYEDNSYNGFVRVYVGDLFSLYVNIDSNRMYEVYPHFKCAPNGSIRVYDNGYGSAKDGVGNFVASDLSKKRVYANHLGVS